MKFGLILTEIPERQSRKSQAIINSLIVSWDDIGMESKQIIDNAVEIVITGNQIKLRLGTTLKQLVLSTVIQ